MTTPAPLPPPNAPLTAPSSAAPSQGYALWFSAVQGFVSGLASSIGSYLTTAGGQTLTGGFQETEVVLTPSGGAITPNPSTSLKQAVTNNAALTIKGTASLTYQQNLGFTKDAFGLVTVPMELPGGVDFAARETYKGISIRIIRAYDPTNDVIPCRLDVLYGVACYYPELAVRLTN
jgi:hypothetical protein